MKFRVIRRSLFFGAQTRWMELDTESRTLRYFDHEPLAESIAEAAAEVHAPTVKVKPKHEFQLKAIAAVEYDATVASIIASPLPPANPPPAELTLKFRDTPEYARKPIRVQMANHDALDSFVGLLLTLSPHTKLLVDGKVSRRVVPASRNAKAKSLTPSSAATAAAGSGSTSPRSARPLPVAASPRVGSMIQIPRSATMRSPLTASSVRAAHALGHAVPKFVQEQREDANAARARDRLHARWNAAPESPKTAVRASPAPSGLTLALAKRNAQTAGAPMPVESKYAPLIQPFTKAIIAKIVQLKSLGGGPPLHLRFMHLNSLLHLLAAPPDPPSFSSPEEQQNNTAAYSLIAEAERLIRAEYELGKESRAYAHFQRMSSAGLKPHPEAEDHHLEAAEEDLKEALRLILQILFDLLALCIGDVDLAESVQERLKEINGTESEMLSELKQASRRVLKQQAGTMFPLDRSKVKKSQSIISISSTPGAHRSFLAQSVNTSPSLLSQTPANTSPSQQPHSLQQISPILAGRSLGVTATATEAPILDSASSVNVFSESMLNGSEFVDSLMSAATTSSPKLEAISEHTPAAPETTLDLAACLPSTRIEPTNSSVVPTTSNTIESVIDTANTGDFVWNEARRTSFARARASTVVPPLPPPSSDSTSSGTSAPASSSNFLMDLSETASFYAELGVPVEGRGRGRAVDQTHEKEAGKQEVLNTADPSRPPEVVAPSAAGAHLFSHSGSNTIAPPLPAAAVSPAAVCSTPSSSTQSCRSLSSALQTNPLLLVTSNAAPMSLPPDVGSITSGFGGTTSCVSPRSAPPPPSRCPPPPPTMKSPHTMVQTPPLHVR